MFLDFLLHEMTALRYYIPLIQEARKSSIKCNVYISRSGKYNDPYKYLELLSLLCFRYDFNVLSVENLLGRENPIVTLEHSGLGNLPPLNKKQKIITVTYATNFAMPGAYKNYSDKSDCILAPSKYFAEYYNVNFKNTYFLGISKFDVKLDKVQICKKYDISQEHKKVLIIYPKPRDAHKVDLHQIYKDLRLKGYSILVKTRGKDPVSSDFLRGDHYFEDYSWHPHTTMELISVSDLIINFGSCAIEECVMLAKPVIDFRVKPFDERGFEKLYHYDYAKTLQTTFTQEEFTESIDFLTSSDFEKEFKKAQKECLVDSSFNSSNSIINFIKEEFYS